MNPATRPHCPSLDDAAAGDPLHLQQQLCFALYAASNRIQRLYRPLLEPLGLTYPQYLVMLVLWQHGQRTVGELGQALHLDSGTLTPLLKRMQTAGLVERSRCTADERRVEVRISADGLALRERAVGIPHSVARATTVPIGELGALRDGVQALLKALGDG